MTCRRGHYYVSIAQFFLCATCGIFRYLCTAIQLVCTLLQMSLVFTVVRAFNLSVHHMNSIVLLNIFTFICNLSKMSFIFVLFNFPLMRTLSHISLVPRLERSCKGTHDEAFFGCLKYNVTHVICSLSPKTSYSYSHSVYMLLSVDIVGNCTRHDICYSRRTYNLHCAAQLFFLSLFT